MFSELKQMSIERPETKPHAHDDMKRTDAHISVRPPVAIQLGLPASVLLGLWLMGFLFAELEAPLRYLFEAAFREAGRLTSGA